MKEHIPFKSGIQLSKRSILTWRIIQTLVWLVGAAILFCLIFFPAIGINLFWNILIPVAPFLLVVFTGVWRNVCPMATNALLPRHLDISKRKRLSTSQIAKLNLVAVLFLYIVVPLRHAFFNTSGLATAILISSMVVLSLLAGLFFEWKSAWCSGLCPVHPVEKLYGSNTLFSIPNAHCGECRNCVIPCPDSTPGLTPFSSTKTVYHKISGYLLVGGFPGFVWGWFHVPDHDKITSLSQLFQIYQLPLLGTFVTVVLFQILNSSFGKRGEEKIISIFAAAAVSCYYWYRIPSLFGLGLYENDGTLLNLKDVAPQWLFLIITISSTVFFFWWIVLRQTSKKSWVIRPDFAFEREVKADKLSYPVTHEKVQL
jgi:hypothetical protein